MKKKAQTGPPWLCDGCHGPIQLGDDYYQVKEQAYCPRCWTGEKPEEPAASPSPAQQKLEALREVKKELEALRNRIDRIESKMAALIRTMLGPKKAAAKPKPPAEQPTLTDELIKLRRGR